MTSKDYNALAAKMMGYCKSDYYLYWDSFQGQPTPYLYDYDAFLNIPLGVKVYEMRKWNPIQDRNQAYQLLKRAEELGLLDMVIIKIRNHFDSPLAFSCPALWLTCPTDIITMACVDVWEG